ncbi:hypothetical protein Tco_1190142 [Tanacetum coccineum]
MNNACAQRWRFDPLPSLWYLAFGGITGDLGLHLEKKDKTMVYTKHSSQDYVLNGWRRRHKIHVTPSRFTPRRCHNISRRRQLA